MLRILQDARLDRFMLARRGQVLTLRVNREVGDERELGRARGLDQRRVERRQRQLAAARKFEVNGVIGGEPVAVLAPVAPARPAKTGEQWLAEMKRLRKGITLGGTVTIRQLIDEGRRY